MAQKANLGRRLVPRASRTTGHHGTKANLGKRLVARALRTTKIMGKRLVGQEDIAGHRSSWHGGQFQAKCGCEVEATQSRLIFVHGTKANFCQCASYWVRSCLWHGRVTGEAFRQTNGMRAIMVWSQAKWGKVLHQRVLSMA